ncbi:MAG: Rpn family recombination-promoting nuclease/putative transposase [Geminocystis sp.]|nr:Rpn family recombination-promoting nuclease/putative transposase [Geminocystis sp.]
MSFDNICKLLAQTYPLSFAAWLLEAPVEEAVVLKTELSVQPIVADSLIFLATPQRILHIEFQTLVQSTPPLGLRMLDYFVRLVRQYQRPVTQVVVFLRQTNHPLAYEEEYRGENTIHRWRVVRMWEKEPDFFLSQPALIPLAPLAKTDSPETLLKRVAESLANIGDKQTRQNLTACTEILAGLRFDKDLILRLLREETMRESVIYQDIFKKGEERGKQIGRQIGYQEGERQLLCRLLEKRFGTLPQQLLNRLQRLEREQLESLGESLFDFSQLSQVEDWLREKGIM